MIAALLIGREGSVGFPGKNVFNVLGRPLMSYPLLAAKHSKYVNKIYVSTDSIKIKDISRSLGAEVIDRPDYLCTKDALGEDAFKHGFEYIEDKCRTVNESLDLIVLLFCNAATFLAKHIDEGIEILKKDTEGCFDSAITISKYNMFSPVRARRITKIGSIRQMQPFIPFEYYINKLDTSVNCDRDAQGDVYFADVCVSVCRPHCLKNLSNGQLPQKWMGQNIAPIENWGGIDIDYEWQVPQVEYWLKKNNFDYERTPYDF
ncbi:MAG: cytidylyltransferase [Oligoflexia bacterium]|nr:cytidylyltransferase [Oligoflexia bacterium]